MRRILTFGFSGLLVLATSLSGCGPKLSDEELGELQTEARQLPGAGESYDLPEPHFESEDAEMEEAEDTPEGESTAVEDAPKEG